MSPASGTPAEPKQISQLDAVTAPATQLPGSRLVVDVPNPAFNPASPGTTKRFLTRYVAYADLVQLLAGGAPTNGQRGTPKIVLYASSTEAGAGPNDSTLDRLASSVLCVGTEATVLLPTVHQLVLAKDPTGPLTVATDGTFSGPTTAARWAAPAEAYVLGELPFSPLTAEYASGARVNARVAGVLRLYSATRLLRRVDFAGNLLPVPGTSADWEEVSPPAAAAAPYATLTEANFLLAFNDNQFSAFLNKRLYITNLASGAGTVTVEVLGSGALATEDAYQFDANNPDAPALPVSLAVANGVVVTHARTAYDDTALKASKAEVWVSGGPKYAARQYLVAAGNGVPTGLYQPKADIGNSISVSLAYYNRIAYLPQSDVDALVAANAAAIASNTTAITSNTTRITTLETFTSGDALKRINSPVYTVSGTTVSGYTSLDALFAAIGGTMAQSPYNRVLHLTQATDSHAVNTSPPRRYTSISGDAADSTPVLLADGVRLYLNRDITRVAFSGTGTVVAQLNGDSVYTDGGAAVLELVGNAANPTINLVNFNIGAWTNPAGGLLTVYLYGTSTVPAAPYPAGVTVVDKRTVTRDTLLTNPEALTPTTGTVTLDFAANPRRTLNATGNVAFATTNRTTAGAEKTVYLKNATGAAISLAYEGWKVFGAGLPATLAAGQELILTLTCLGTSVSDVKAAAVLSV